MKFKILELEDEIQDLKDRLSSSRNYSEALCRKLAERDAEIKVLREILFERSKTKNK